MTWNGTCCLGASDPGLAAYSRVRSGCEGVAHPAVAGAQRRCRHRHPHDLALRHMLYQLSMSPLLFLPALIHQPPVVLFFFLNNPAPPEISPLPPHAPLPI